MENEFAFFQCKSMFLHNGSIIFHYYEHKATLKKYIIYKIQKQPALHIYK